MGYSVWFASKPAETGVLLSNCSSGESWWRLADMAEQLIFFASRQGISNLTRDASLFPENITGW